MCDIMCDILHILYTFKVLQGCQHLRDDLCSLQWEMNVLSGKDTKQRIDEGVSLVMCNWQLAKGFSVFTTYNF